MKDNILTHKTWERCYLKVCTLVENGLWIPVGQKNMVRFLSLSLFLLVRFLNCLGPVLEPITEVLQTLLSQQKHWICPPFQILTQSDYDKIIYYTLNRCYENELICIWHGCDSFYLSLSCSLIQCWGHTSRIRLTIIWWKH